ncbi:ribonuclease M5 [Pseudalkalibacillus caeni]|nr:ribonuclease M5 [Pseudalkalibacillus caeni]
MKIKEVIVVEGKSDTIAVQRAVKADTLETNGSEISESTLNQIELAQKRRGVIVFTDPDFPGERIRKIISERVPGCKHAFLPKKEGIAKSGKGLGIEHASCEAIRLALGKVKEEMEDPDEIIPWEDLIAAGLVGGSKAKQRRELLGEVLNIGYMNGKQLYKRLKMFQVSKEEFSQAMRRVLQEEK